MICKVSKDLPVVATLATGGGYFMITEYIQAAMEKATYEIINDEEPYFAKIPELQGVWANGKTLEECRKNLKEVLEEWIVISIKKSLPIPPIEKCKIEVPTEMETSA